MNEPEHIGVTIRAMSAGTETPARHPIVRSGEREPIPALVRLSIYARDGRRCCECGLEHPALELDHIVPWSAGGGDHSSNLRTLCQPCNQRRSNYQDGAEDRLPAATTWWCWHCWRHPEIEVDDPDLVDWAERGGLFRSIWKDGTNTAAAPWVTEPSERVYCATCQTHSLSDVLFSQAMQTGLVDLCAGPLRDVHELDQVERSAGEA